MDDLQFNDSLDALLESETLHGVRAGGDSKVSSPFHPSRSLSSSVVAGTRDAQARLRQSRQDLQDQHLQQLHLQSQPQPRMEEPTQNGAPSPPQGLLGAGSTSVAGGPAYSGQATWAAFGASPFVVDPLCAPPALPNTAVSSVSGPSIAQRGITLPSTTSLSNVTGQQNPTTASAAASNPKPPPQAAAKKRARDVSEVSEDEGGDNVKRRSERNLREQQRSQRITQQITELREVLLEANIQFKPDKYSTLVTVGDYIKQLQSRSAALESEHKKLVDTIAKTNEMVNSPYGSSLSSSSPDEKPSNPDATVSVEGSNLGDDSDGTTFVSDIDYKNIFSSCGVPLAVASIDGRFMDCNKEFETLTGFTREELILEVPKSDPSTMVPGSSESQVSAVTSSTSDSNSSRNLSLFNLLRQEDMENVFMAMSDMLKQTGDNEMGFMDPDLPSSGNDRWSGIVHLNSKDEKIKMNVSLVRSPKGRARFFDCALTPVPGDLRRRA